MSLPAANAISTAADQAALKTALEDHLAASKTFPGAVIESELTIASGSVTATRAAHSIDTESDAAADTLTNVDISTFVGFEITLRCEAAARVVTLTHEAGGAGQLSLLTGADLVLDATTKIVRFRVDTGASPTTLVEIARFGFDSPGSLEVNTAVSASPNILTAGEVGKPFSNEGATAANYHTLPSAVAGMRFGPFVVQDADGIRITANTGDTIRWTTSVTPAAGYIEATALGNTVELLAINATEWVAISYVGTWTVSS